MQLTSVAIFMLFQEKKNFETHTRCLHLLLHLSTPAFILQIQHKTFKLNLMKTQMQTCYIFFATRHYPHLYQVFHLLLHLSRPWFVISFKFDIINQLRATKHIFTFFPVKITDRFVYNFSIATIKMRAHATLLRDPCVGVHKCVIHTETSRP